jgi:predicted GTPase
MAAIIMLIIPGVLFSSLAQPQIDSLADTTTREQGLSALGTEKVLDIAENASAAFLGGIRTQAIIMLVISLVLIALGIAWRIREQRRGAEP